LLQYWDQEITVAPQIKVKCERSAEYEKSNLNLFDRLDDVHPEWGKNCLPNVRALHTEEVFVALPF